MSRSFENPAAGRYTDTPDLQKLSQLISTNIQKMTTNVTQLQTLQAQITAKPDNLELQDKFHRIQHQTNPLAKEITKNIKELSDFSLARPEDQKQQKLRKERFLNDFSKVLHSLQQLQRQEKTIERTEQDKRTSNVALGHDDPQNPFGDPNESTGVQLQQQQVSLNIDLTEADAELMQEREEAVRQLETDIADVNNIFKDLALLVHEQGDAIDTIEANTESAVVNVEQGTEELRVARVYSTKARKKKLCLVLTLLSIIIIIAIVLAGVYGGGK